ncbi:MAG TPA: helix-turn-helix transcriptional regulator [Vicinamibacterales bacterium]|nr:helix-turn-helix transcriptional regulator [Vicinamibacterales bacterium]
MTDRTLFGDRLRRARERSRLTLPDVADRTKLSAARLRSLEEGVCASWPTGVYSRSYVRAYADLVGLDPAETVQEFVELFPQLAWANQDQYAEVAAVRARSRAAASAPLRLLIDEPPLPFWRAWLIRLALVLHRWATRSASPRAGAAGGYDPIDGQAAGEGAYEGMPATALEGAARGVASGSI